MASVVGNPHLNIRQVVAVGKMLAPSLTWAEMRALCERGAGGEGKEQRGAEQGHRGFLERQQKRWAGAEHFVGSGDW